MKGSGGGLAAPYEIELEAAVKMVLDQGLATGHADSFTDLIAELLDQYAILREQYIDCLDAHS